MTFVETVIESPEMKNAELVVKSNRLIEASYRLGLTEQRIILYAICRCRDEEKGLFPNEPVIITAEAFLKKNPNPRRDEVKLAISGNLCRCTGYAKINDAVLLAAAKMRGEEAEA